MEPYDKNEVDFILKITLIVLITMIVIVGAIIFNNIFLIKL